MHHHILCSPYSLKALFNKIFAGRSKHLNCHIIGNKIIHNKSTWKFKFNFRGRRETNFNFFKTNINQQLKQLKFLFEIHRLDKCLIPVPKIHTAPIGCFRDRFTRPGTVRKIYSLKGFVFFNSFRFHALPPFVSRYQPFSFAFTRPQKKGRSLRCGLLGIFFT